MLALIIMFRLIDFAYCSTAGHTMLPKIGQKVYNSSKTALTYLTEGFRHELSHAGSKIKVTVSFLYNH